MNDLTERIRMAQVEAGENAVVDDLRRKGLLPPTKTAIAIGLDQLRGYMRQFIDEHASDSSSVTEYEWRLKRSFNGSASAVQQTTTY
jgi:hypothetical protein